MTVSNSHGFKGSELQFGFNYMPFKFNSCAATPGWGGASFELGLTREIERRHGFKWLKRVIECGFKRCIFKFNFARRRYVAASEFIEWAMRQPEVRDQCDALFMGNELLTRGVFLPVSYGEDPPPRLVKSRRDTPRRGET